MARIARTRTLALALGAGILAAASSAAAQTSAQAAKTAFAASATPAATPAALPSAAAAWVGVYRITLQSKTAGAVQARVVMERVEDAVDGTFLVNGTNTTLKDIRIDGDELRARVLTSTGEGTLVLRNGGSGIAGTLTAGKASWEISGARSI
jgi:hypothetical protein